MPLVAPLKPSAIYTEPAIKNDTANERMQQSCKAGLVNDLVHQTMDNYGGLQHADDYQQPQSEEAHILRCETKKSTDPFYFHYRCRKLSCDNKVSSKCPVHFFENGLEPRVTGKLFSNQVFHPSSWRMIDLCMLNSVISRICKDLIATNQPTELDSYTNNKGGIISSHKFILTQFVDQDELQRVMEDKGHSLTTFVPTYQ